MSNFRSQILDITLNGAFPGVDTIMLATDIMPGQWILEPGGVTFGWQKQQGWGLDGGTIRPTGLEIAEASFAVRFWNLADWQAFEPLRQKYLSKAAYTLAAFKTYAIGILHPELNKVGVTSVAPAQAPWFSNSGRGMWVGRVKFIQYRKAKPVLESPDATIPAAAAPTPSAADNAASEGALHQNQIAGARG